jgi:DNA-binding MarR family transcriptional regulator
MTAAAEVQERRPTEVLEQGLLRDFAGPKLRVLWNLLSSRVEAVLAPFGMRNGGYSSLAIIAANPGCSQNQLAKALGMDKSAVVLVLDDLERRGLVRRKRSTRDRRRHDLSLTAEGEAIMMEMSVHVASVGQPIRNALSKREYDQLLSLLGRAYDALAAAD